nr:DUF5115 domain-containing protein [uncultured Bacteroides sp.]
MKKTLLYLITLVTLTMFSACNEDFENWADPQTNKQEAAKSLAFQIAANGTATYDLNTITTDSVDIVKKTSLSNDSATTVSYELLIDKTDTYENKLVYPLTFNGDVFKMAKADLQTAIEKLYGKRPQARQLSVCINAYVITTAGQASVVQSNDLTITATPKAPVIESAYYLIGGMNDWDGTKLVKFTHSDKDVYEDPYFTVVVKVPADCYWKIIPQSNVDGGDVWASGVLGTATDGDISMTGALTATNPQAGKIAKEAGYVKFTLNMMESTYTIDYIGDMALQLYVPGAHQGWSPATAPIVYCQNYDMKYDGYVNFTAADQEYKFTAQPDWGPVEYGNGGNGTLVTTGGGNMKVSTAGFYRVTANLSTTPMTYTATKTEWKIIGDATAGGWDAATPMTLNAATGEWTLTTTLVGGKLLKFRANDNWNVNLGGDVNNLTYGGDNIAIATDGTYAITLKLGDPTAYKCTIVKQ